MDCWNKSGDDPLDSPGFEPQPSGSFGSKFDEVTLQQIAEMTGGEFYFATSAAELQLVFQNLHSYMAMTNKTVEISVYFAAIGAVMAMVAQILSIIWHPLL